MSSAVSAQTLPATQPLEALKGRERARLASSLTALPSLGQKSLAEVVRLELAEQELVVKTALKPTDGPARVQLTDLPGWSVVNIQGNAGESNYRSFQFFHDDVERPGVVSVHTEIFAIHNGHVQVTRSIAGIEEDVTIQLIQAPNLSELEDAVRLYVQGVSHIAEQTTLDIKISAATVVELRRQFPRETAAHLRPIFRELGADALLFGVEPALAWQVFAGEAKVDPAATAAVKAILPQLDAADFPTRQRALAELRKLGQAGALALLGMDRGGLSAEQNARIDEVLAPYRTLSAEQVNAFRKDNDFLLSCLRDGDEQLRVLAKKQLEQNLGRSVTFDPAGPAAEREVAVRQIEEALRK